MESRLKYNFFKRKNVESLNFMHSLDDFGEWNTMYIVS